MDLFPHIKKTLTGDILMRDSAKAKKLANKYQGPHKAKEPAEVVRSAERLAAQMELINPSLFELRSLYEIQFGKYRDQTFQWLMENAIGYASYIVATMQREGGGTPNTPLGHNKEQLKVSDKSNKKCIQRNQKGYFHIEEKFLYTLVYKYLIRKENQLKNIVLIITVISGKFKSYCCDRLRSF